MKARRDALTELAAVALHWESPRSPGWSAETDICRHMEEGVDIEQAGGEVLLFVVVVPSAVRE
jgi:hypothetical protein